MAQQELRKASGMKILLLGKNGQVGWVLQHASRVISDMIHFYNHRRPHQALALKTPAKTYESFKLAA